ncbi:MAG: type IX secretion system outer membrane channel protein PorV [Cyclobacteriaceae bacterium]|nr:type IX secretion system outer membrane channel protein PorV [Cyclobacteriaceae bacterium]
MKVKIIVFSIALIAGASTAFAQVNVAGQDTSRRVITTAVPFLMIAPDARAGAMGDAGVATSADANAAHWNIAKLAYIKNDIGFSLSVSPWLGKIINDMSLSYLSGYYKINKEQVVSASLTYFDLGDMTFTDNDAKPIQNFNPREFAFSGSYARLLSEDMSLGVTLKFIYSNLTGNVYTSSLGGNGQAGVSVAADIGWYWKTELGLKSDLALGATITDLGNKLTYSNDEQKEFIPTTFRLGGAYTYHLDPNNSLTLALDFTKLMVPTPPIYEVDENGDPVLDQNGQQAIARGKDPDRPFLRGVFGSFSDAPDGFGEELREVMISTGVEYWYKDIFAVRGGYFWEDANKGDRKFFTMGVGLRYNVFGVDFAYLVPTTREHPLAETLRFTIHFNFETRKIQESIINEGTN